MSDNSFNRLRGRAAIEAANLHLLAGLIMVGILLAGLLTCSLLIFVHWTFVFGIILQAFMLRHTVRHIRDVAQAHNKYKQSAYASDDKQYVWDVEATRDRLLARIIQENVCPWSKEACHHIGSCPKASCLCSSQLPGLASLGYIDLNNITKNKTILNERDSCT